MRCMATRILLLMLPLMACCCNVLAGKDGRAGKWELLLNNSGVVAMHMALTHRNTVIIFDQTTAGRSGYRLEKCSSATHRRRRWDCWAHSVEYDVGTNRIRPLALETDTWCSSGAFLSNGTLVQTGGSGDGSRRIRYFDPSSKGRCRWRQSGLFLADKRWYATNQVLPEKDRVFVVGGRRVFSYEFIPKTSSEKHATAFHLPFLRETYDRGELGNNMYPFVHLSPDGNLFIFANRDSILFNYQEHRVLKRFPRIPGNGARSYPSTGSSVMLPLNHADGFNKVEVMVCGGAKVGARKATEQGHFLEALSSCGRITLTDKDPRWAMEQMPGPRLMSDMLILPTGDILIINGATHGCAGWRKARNASHSPYLYKPMKKIGKRFSVLSSSTIPRVYHSSAIVLPDGRVLVAGSNPYRAYNFSGRPYRTELRMEAFSPYYMESSLDDKRASNIVIRYSNGNFGIKYGDEFVLRFELQSKAATVAFHVYAPPFATHSVSMNQRMLVLECRTMEAEEGGRIRAVVAAPPSPRVAPAGYYLLTVVNGEIPSRSKWVRFIHE